jgi:hypothetical protein
VTPAGGPALGRAVTLQARCHRDVIERRISDVYASES